MSNQDISQQDPIKIAEDAERQLNSYEAKTGNKSGSTSTDESGVDSSVESRFDGAEVKYGSEASGAGGNRDIPDEEGGGINPETGRQTKARDFEGVGGPEEKMEAREAANPGDQDVQGNVRN